MLPALLMKAFRVEGRVVRYNVRFSFCKEITGEDEADATERLVSELGSKHRAKRPQIHIDSITELAPEDVTDPITAHKLGSA